MDNAYFLISDIQVEDGAHQLLHSLTCAQINAEVFSLVGDFERLKPLRDEFPSAIFILLDLKKNVDVSKGCLRILPSMDCFLNFSGETFTAITQGDPIKVSRDCEMSYSSISLEGIAEELTKSEDIGAVLVNIVHEASSGSGVCGVFSGDKDQAPPYGPAGSQPVRFRMGSKIVKPLTLRVPSPATENQPLLASTRSQEEPEAGFLSCLFCFCYPYCTSDTVQIQFDSPEQLIRFIRSEQTAEIRQKLESFFELAESDWNRRKEQLGYKEQKKIEELVSKIENKKYEEESELHQENDSQNATTQANLTGVLSPETIERIKASRERHASSKVRHDTGKAFKEGERNIKKAAEMEWVISRDENYSKVLLKQFDILTNINEKYKKKLDRMLEKNFPKLKNV